MKVHCASGMSDYGKQRILRLLTDRACRVRFLQAGSDHLSLYHEDFHLVSAKQTLKVSLMMKE